MKKNMLDTLVGDAMTLGADVCALFGSNDVTEKRIEEFGDHIAGAPKKGMQGPQTL